MQLKFSINNTCLCYFSVIVHNFIELFSQRFSQQYNSNNIIL